MSRLYPVLKYGAILGWSAFVVAPFLWALTTSFKTINGVTSGPRYLPWLQYEPSLQGWTSLSILWSHTRAHTRIGIALYQDSFLG